MLEGEKRILNKKRRRKREGDMKREMMRNKGREKKSCV